jgi:hypothetical protein
VSTRRLVAVLAASAVAVATASLVSPSYAVEAPRLLGASIVVDTGFTPTSVTTTFRFAGDVVGVEATWSTGTGVNVQQVSSGIYQVNAGLSVYDLPFSVRPWMQAGTWTLTRVSLTSREGVAPVVYGAGALALPGPAATFDNATGPATLAEVGDLAGTISEATVTTPSVDPKTIATSGTLTATLLYGGAVPGQTSFQPVWSLVGSSPTILRGLTSSGPGAAGGSLPIPFTANSTYFNNGDWALTRVIGRGGPATRVFDKDGYVTYVRASTDLSGSAGSCDGYLGDLTGITPDPACRTVSQSSTSISGLGDPANVVTMTGMGVAHLTAPVLSSATLSSPTVAVGGTVTVTAHYADAQDAPQTGQELYLRMHQGASFFYGQYSPTTTCTGGAPYDCTVSVDIHVPTDAASGAYSLEYIYSVNAAGNNVYIEPTSYTTYIEDRSTTTSTLPPAAAAMFGLSLTVTGGIAADSTAPLLTSITRTSPAQVDTSDPMTTPNGAVLHWTGTDVGTGIAQVDAVLYAPSTQGYVGVGWAPTSPAVSGTSGDIDVSAYTATGDWVVRSVTVTDRRGNVRHYDADGAVAPATPATTHSLDFASLGFTLVGVPAIDVPNAPRALRVSGRDTTLVATWAAPLTAGGTPVSSYDVTLAPGGATQSVTGTTATFTGLSNDTGYTVTVKASNSLGAGPSAWAPGTWVHPVAPLVGPTLTTVPAFVSRSPSIPLLASPPAAEPGAPVTGYVTQVRWAAPGAAFPASWVTTGAVRPAPSTTLAVSRGTRVCVRIAAVNTIGVGGASAVRCTTVLGDERALLASTGWTRAVVKTAYARTLSTSKKAGASLALARAYGSRIVIAGLAVPGGGTVAVYVGSTRVAIVSFAQAKVGYVERTVKIALKGGRVTLKVLTPGKGVSIDGLAITP